MLTSLHFDTPFPYGKSVLILKSLSEKILDRITTKPSLLYDLNSRRDYIGFIQHEVNYARLGYTAYEVYLERQVLALYQKNAWIDIGVDTSEVALQAFYEAEESCFSTNRRLRCPSVDSEISTDSSLYFRVMRKIADILGPYPGIEALDFGFGPGANVGVSRLTSTRRKLSVSPTCTTSASKYIPYLLESHPHWEMLKTAIPCNAGRLTFVPKSAKTDRCIVVEPLVNTYLQKGVGKYIRTRLRRSGCNLNSQATNQQGARIGSLNGTLSTVDLASASDTISREVVKALLPYEWWSFLNDIRTEEVTLPDGTVKRLQKFSSMGNGFTFELESLIFFAVCKVVCDPGDFVSVYGDDIIIPVGRYDDLVTALTQFGFKVNPSKSFRDGPFRESCGRDFFGGIDVRPCYVKEELSVKEIFRLHNFFVRHDEADLANFLLQYIPTRYHIFGPDGFGDGHLLGRFIPSPYKRDWGWSGYCFRSFMTKPYKRKDPQVGDYAAFLYSSLKGSGFDVVSPSSGVFLPDEIDDVQASESIYSERSKQRRYRLSRIYTLGTT